MLLSNYSRRRDGDGGPAHTAIQVNTRRNHILFCLIFTLDTLDIIRYIFLTFDYYRCIMQCPQFGNSIVCVLLNTIHDYVMMEADLCSGCRYGHLSSCLRSSGGTRQHQRHKLAWFGAEQAVASSRTTSYQGAISSSAYILYISSVDIRVAQFWHWYCDEYTTSANQ